MYIQGNLQSVFDALYQMGVIDPVLEKDWAQALDEISEYQEDVNEVVRVVNSHQDDVDALVEELSKFDEKTLEYLAMEVAREFADFHARTDLH